MPERARSAGLAIAAAGRLGVGPVSAAPRQDDSLRLTSDADQQKASDTARRLFDDAGRAFERVRHIAPVRDRLLVPDDFDTGGTAPLHEASFATFDADFEIDVGDRRRLVALRTRSRRLVLRPGLPMGQSTAQVRARLGAPTATSRHESLHEIGGEALRDVFSRFESGRLVEVDRACGVAD